MLLSSLLMLATAQVSCPVTGSAVSLSASERTVLERAQEKLCSTVAGRFDSAKLSLISVANVPDDVLTSAIAAELDVGTMRAGRVPVTAVWANSKGNQHRGVVWFRVYGTTEAWVFNADVKAEAIVSTRDIVRSPVDLAAMDLSKDKLPVDPTAMAVVKAGRKGQLVRADQLRIPALVLRQQQVRVIVHQESMRIVTRARALTTGWDKHDDVQIEVTGSTEPVMAKVAGKDEVYVEM